MVRLRWLRTSRRRTVRGRRGRVPGAPLSGSRPGARRKAGNRNTHALRSPARPSRQVDVARPIAVVLPRDVAEPPLPPRRERQARPALLARARARVVHALGGRERRAAVEAGREEDVVVAEAVVLPGDEE